MVVKMVVSLIAALTGTVVYILYMRKEERKEERKMNDTRCGTEELIEAFTKLGCAGMADGPIGTDSIIVLSNPPDLVTYSAAEPATGDDVPLKAASCPNCGAPAHSAECEYCGSVFIKGRW